MTTTRLILKNLFIGMAMIGASFAAGAFAHMIIRAMLAGWRAA